MLAILFATAITAASPQALVAQFCAAYLRQHEYGTLEGENRRRLAPMLSTRLLRQADDMVACQRDWQRQQPKGSTDKPPFVDCCLFSSTPDGMPTAFSVGAATPLPGGRARVVVNYVRKTKIDDIQWRDAYVVFQEKDRWVIDDVIYDADEDSALLSNETPECKGGRWIGEH